MSSSNFIDVFADNRVKASIDKLTIIGRSSMDILFDDIEELVARNGNNQFLCEKTVHEGLRGYRLLYEISYLEHFEDGKNEVCKLVLLIGNNMGWPNFKAQRAFKIEFNPNKFKVPDWLLYYFVDRKYEAEEVKEIDLAFDFIGIPKKLFRYALNNGNTKIRSEGTPSNLTDYIGCNASSPNRIKIYDKKKERERFYRMDMETTRVEITLEWKYYGKRFTSFDSDIYVLKHVPTRLKQVFIAYDAEKDAFVYALSCLSPSELNVALSLMSINSRTKYRRLLQANGGTNIYCNPVILREFLHNELENILGSLGLNF